MPLPLHSHPRLARALLVSATCVTALLGSRCGPAVPPHPPAPPAGWSWVPIAGSQCASGSTTGVGMNLPAEGGTELLVYLEGGGACWNPGTCLPSPDQYGPVCDYGTTCAVNDVGGTQPTSIHVTEADPFPTDGGGRIGFEMNALLTGPAFDRADPANPFRGAAFLFVPYCTGDVHSGNAAVTYPYRTSASGPLLHTTIHFAGAANMDLFIAAVKAALPGLKTIWLTGSSAGGYGAQLNFDRWAKAFPDARVHVLADASPLVQPPQHFAEWRDTWAMRLPEGCAECDAGLPQVHRYLLQHYPDSRFALLAHDADTTLSWFFYADAGVDALAHPPVAAYGADLRALEAVDDGFANAHHFVKAGPEHTYLWGGFNDTVHSDDGGTTLRRWMTGWALGTDGGWESQQ